MEYYPVLFALGALAGFAYWLFVVQDDEDEDHWAGDHPDSS